MGNEAHPAKSNNQVDLIFSGRLVKECPVNNEKDCHGIPSLDI